MDIFLADINMDIKFNLEADIDTDNYLVILMSISLRPICHPNLGLWKLICNVITNPINII